MVIRGVVFDVDDTLYDERDYVRSGFAAVARAAGRTDIETKDLDAWLWSAFEAGARGDTFDRLRAAYPGVAARLETDSLIDVYRSHVPDIHLADGARDTLDRLRDLGLRLGALTDGPVASQAAKVAALGLDRWFEPILLTGAMDAAFAKPGTAGFELIARAWGLPAAELAYVGDNPAKDFVGPRALGWATVQLAHPRQVRARPGPIDDRHRADFLIDDLTELMAILSLEGR